MATAVLERNQVQQNLQQDQKPLQDVFMVRDVSVKVNYAHDTDVRVTEQEVRAYIERGNRRNPNSTVSGLTLDVDGEDVGIFYEYNAVPFDRIRRITGYLVGTLDRFNDGKRAEEHDRVKHGVPQCCR
ncbi:MULTISPECIES: anaerobic ribonucleoside-triphosphate reductase [unclassified Adlercreutzia]|uniref:anaerobic ribonucleoside-triphosphate reductase n=1 Tax=unclassified Adlercreutzia TaxID=2636013 RepID=UPI001F14A594|nr:MULTISPECIES: anaerobic ribonucleoside-triphosphate reductase [unclassified Adlercreutzia]